LIKCIEEFTEDGMPVVYVIHHYTGATPKRNVDLILGMGVLFRVLGWSFLRFLYPIRDKFGDK
jgi:hypothetical protein